MKQKRIPEAKAVWQKGGVKKNEINNAMSFIHIKTCIWNNRVLKEHTDIEGIISYTFEWFPMKGGGKQEQGIGIKMNEYMNEYFKK